jgi:hypothetical protein
MAANERAFTAIQLRLMTYNALEKRRVHKAQNAGRQTALLQASDKMYKTVSRADSSTTTVILLGHGNHTLDDVALSSAPHQQTTLSEPLLEAAATTTAAAAAASGVSASGSFTDGDGEHTPEPATTISCQWSVERRQATDIARQPGPGGEGVTEGMRRLVGFCRVVPFSGRVVDVRMHTLTYGRTTDSGLVGNDCKRNNGRDHRR